MSKTSVSNPSIGSRQWGYSLIEIMLVIVIVSTLVIAAFVLYAMLDPVLKARQERQNIIAIQHGVKSVFNRYEYSAIRNSVLNRAKVFPRGMNGGDYSATAPIRSVWGQPVEVWGAYLVDGSADTVFPANHFHIFYRSMPNAICQKLVPPIFKEFEKVYVGGLHITTMEEAVGMCSPIGEPTVHVFFVSK